MESLYGEQRKMGKVKKSDSHPATSVPSPDARGGKQSIKYDPSGAAFNNGGGLGKNPNQA